MIYAIYFYFRHFQIFWQGVRDSFALSFYFFSSLLFCSIVSVSCMCICLKSFDHRIFNCYAAMWYTCNKISVCGLHSDRFAKLMAMLSMTIAFFLSLHNLYLYLLLFLTTQMILVWLWGIWNLLANQEFEILFFLKLYLSFCDFFFFFFFAFSC